MPEGSVRNFDEISDRLDQIIATVRSKDTSLERSLDLFDEAIELGSRAVDMVDKFELTPREADKLVQEYDEDAANESQLARPHLRIRMVDGIHETRAS